MQKIVICGIATGSMILIIFTSSFSQGYTAAKPYGDPKLIPDFLCSEVMYPEDAIRNETEGEVIIAFR